jgi:hypothetical protein
VVNGVEIDLSDTAAFHFHPGFDGEPDAETDPPRATRKSALPPISRRRSFFAHRLVALACADPTQPGPDFHVLGIYRTLRPPLRHRRQSDRLRLFVEPCQARSIFCCAAFFFLTGGRARRCRRSEGPH